MSTVSEHYITTEEYLHRERNAEDAKITLDAIDSQLMGADVYDKVVFAR